MHHRALRGCSGARRSVGSAEAALFVDARVIASREGVIAMKLPELTRVLLCAYPLVGLPLAFGLFAQGLLACCFLLLSLNALLLRLQLLLLRALKRQSLRVLLLL